MAYKMAVPLGYQFEDSNGDPLSGGYIEFYVTGTSTATPIYSDSAGTSAGTSITLNSLGQPQNSGSPISLFFDDSITYKLKVFDSEGTQVGPDYDPFNVVNSAGGQLVVDSVATLYGGDYSTFSYATTQAFTAGGSKGGAEFYKGTNGGTQTTSGTLYTHLALGYVVDAGGNYWHFKPDQAQTLSKYGTGGADDSDAINAALTNADHIVVDDDYYFSDITIPSNKTFSGPGTLIGVAPTGSRPTRATLNAEASSAERLSLLEGYYNGKITITSNAKINGELNVSDALFVGSSSSYVDVRGYINSDDIAFHGIGVYANGGQLESTSGMIVSDSADKSIRCHVGGRVSAPSAIIVHAVGRSIETDTGGDVSANAAEIYNGGDDGVYCNTGGNISISGATVDNCAGDGILTNYGGNIDLGAGTVNNCTGSGISAESGGQIYAVGATVTGNGQAGLFGQYGGTIQATGATITGNTSLAVDCRGNSVINIQTATIDLTNNSGGTQVRILRGGIVYAEEPGVGSGKTALAAASYNPPYNTTSIAGGFIGEPDPAEPFSELGGILFDSDSETISSGSITAKASKQLVDTEAAAASDDLDTIEITSIPDLIYLFPASETRTVVIKNGTGNISCTTGADITLDTRNKGAMLIKANTVWLAMPLF